VVKKIEVQTERSNALLLLYVVYKKRTNEVRELKASSLDFFPSSSIVVRQ